MLRDSHQPRAHLATHKVKLPSTPDQLVVQHCPEIGCSCMCSLCDWQPGSLTDGADTLQLPNTWSRGHTFPQAEGSPGTETGSSSGRGALSSGRRGISPVPFANLDDCATTIEGGCSGVSGAAWICPGTAPGASATPTAAGPIAAAGSPRGQGQSVAVDAEDHLATSQRQDGSRIMGGASHGLRRSVVAQHLGLLDPAEVDSDPAEALHRPLGASQGRGPADQQV
jgi:hypothetical protein